MKTYRIYVHPAKPVPIVVKVGFCWPAFLIGPLWFVVNGMWINFLLVTLLVGASHLLALYGNRDPMFGLIGLLYFITWLLVGVFANSFLAAELVSEGYVPRGTVQATSMFKASDLAREQNDAS
jgi:hypothetical protein